MTELKQIYKCNICGNIVEVLHTGVGTLVCCGKPMELQAEKIKDEGKEKHVPIIEESKDKIIVRVGSIPHPMEEKHYIEWVELNVDGASFKKFLKPSDKPEAEFCVCNGKKISARIYCNIHGLWRS